MIIIRGAWVAQEVEPLTLDFGSGHDPKGHGIEPRVGFHAECGVCLIFLISLPLPLSPAHVLSKKKKKRWQSWAYTSTIYYLLLRTCSIANATENFHQCSTGKAMHTYSVQSNSIKLLFLNYGIPNIWI